jgi:hypothetical protein
VNFRLGLVADDGIGRGGSGSARGSLAKGSAAIGDRAHKFLVKFGLK